MPSSNPKHRPPAPPPSLLHPADPPDDATFDIRPRRVNPLVHTTRKFARTLIEYSLKLHEIDRIYRESRALPDDLPFAERVLQTMNVRYDIDAANQARIPREGPVVVVANHPFGGIEGIVMIALLQRIRPDVRVMANYLLGRIAEMRENFIFVDPFGSQQSRQRNMRPLKESLQWLRDGGLLATFPAGEVSSVDLRTGQIRDPAWSVTVASLVRHANASVLPVFFSGHNGPLFQLAGLVHPRFRTLMLPAQVVNKRNHVIRVHVGAPIPWSELADYESDEERIRYLRLRTYLLEGRENTAPRRLRLPRRRRGVKPQQPIADPLPPEQLQSEVDALADDQKLLENGDLRVYVARADQMPTVMQELGRLREVTFRSVGEGTGNAADIDVFDAYYLHLFIWNARTREVVGAYRLGMADAICAEYGSRGLYTHTLFRFNSRLLRCMQPAIELGRSFVRPEYQKAYASLFMLWKGIAAFLVRNPRYRTLFGPVSITNEYRDASRDLMLRSLRLSNFSTEMARFVKARKRPKRPRRAEWHHPDFRAFLDNIGQVSDMIQDIESDQKGIPILLRQYLKLGGKILAFNVDPTFSSVVDALIAIDLTETDPRVLRRYMGTENAEVFLRQHPAAGANPLSDEPPGKSLPHAGPSATESTP